MELFKNALITLEYEPGADILSVDMPKVDNLNLQEIKRTLATIVDYVRNYDVKRLLVDARKTVVEVDAETYTAIVEEFSRNLMATRIQKVARITTPSSVRETAVKKVYEDKDLPIQFRSFAERTSAIDWLKE